MKEILKPVFNWIVDQYQLFDNPLYNYIAMAIVGMIGFGIAFRFVGDLYRMDIIDGRAAGSIIHWTVRLIVVTVLFLIVSGIIWIVKFIATIPWWIWVIVGSVALLILIVLIVFHFKKQRPIANEERE